MKFALISTNSTYPFAPFCAFAYTSSNSKPKYQNQNQNPNPITTFCKPFTLPTILSLKSSHSKPSRLVALCASRAAKPSNAELENSRLDEEVLSEETIVEDENSQSQWNVEVGNPIVPANVVKLSLSDQAFLLLAFIACTVRNFQFFIVNCVVRLAAFNSFNGGFFVCFKTCLVAPLEYNNGSFWFSIVLEVKINSYSEQDEAFNDKILTFSTNYRFYKEMRMTSKVLQNLQFPFLTFL